MKETYTFISSLFKSPKQTGAILPSSRILTKRMLSYVNFERAKNIVELGPGIGVFTEEILKRKKKDSNLFLCEKNEKFVSILQKKFKDIPIFQGCATQMSSFLDSHSVPPQSVDYVISGLPFGIFDNDLIQEIFTQISSLLHTDGLFVAFQYSKMKLPLFEKYFDLRALKYTLLNIPPAYVLVCKKKSRSNSF